jgi:hypothetical protein
MSHESVIASLKKLIKQDLLTIDPKEHAHYTMGESDRTSIILCASLIEDMIVRKLEAKMPSINADERNRLFNFEGPCGSFSNRIRMAQALGIIDRPLKKRIELVKEMRNVAAHSHAHVGFDTIEIKKATAALLAPAQADEIAGWPHRRVRAVFTSFTMMLANELAAPTDDTLSIDANAFWEWIRAQKVKPAAFRGKSSGASRRSRHQGKRGK